jgi:hypothetical protein
MACSSTQQAYSALPCEVHSVGHTAFLPFTGLNVMMVLMIGLALIALGIVLYVNTRVSA